MVDIKITYETLFDLLRREKNREEIQTLDKDFYEQLLSYLKEKETLLSGKEDTSYFSADREKLKIQFQNIRRLVKELYERREKKIINIALVKARTGSDIIDTSNLLPCEIEFFDEMVDLFSKFRKEILDNVINLKEFSGIVNSTSNKFTSVSSEEISQPEMPRQDAPIRKPSIHERPVPEGKSRIIVIDTLPKFMGRGGEILGPYEKGAVVDLDSQIAELLIKKGRAQMN
jgi:DNA replication initiation complex subunit (GINS family)